MILNFEPDVRCGGRRFLVLTSFGGDDGVSSASISGELCGAVSVRVFGSGD